MRLLADCKSNSPNISKVVIGTSSNTSYWKIIIGKLIKMLLEKEKKEGAHIIVIVGL
jgi:K+-sensing histidine kinase KdpD